MALTNALTAQAATQPSQRTRDDLMLIGLFTDPNGARALLRDRSGAILQLTEGQSVEGFTLDATGDGWALIREGRTHHRLVLG